MGVKIKVLGRTEDGAVKTFTAAGACYRNIGKDRSYLGEVRNTMDGASPVTLTHENMCNNIPKGIKDSHIKIFAKLWDIVPALRTCISTPAEILSSKRATFDVANYSLNEVMVAMFFMRTLVNDHANDVRGYNAVPCRDNLELLRMLTEDKGWSWEKSYLFALCPHHNNSYAKQINYQSKHLGGMDACCFRFNTVSVETMFQFLRGEYEGWSFCDKLYDEVIREDSGYTQNISSQVKTDGAVKGERMHGVFADLCSKAMRGCSNSTSTDLFGGTIVTGSAEHVEYLDAWGQAYDELEGEINANN